MNNLNSRDLLLQARDTLKKAGSETPYLDAMILLSSACNITREQLYARLGDALTEQQAASFEDHVLRRASGIPVAYIVGYQEFYGRRFQVDERVLVPRPDTEILVETALGLLAGTTDPEVHDCCTGSGCIAVSIAAERRDARVSMSDIDPRALQVAAGNAERILGHSLSSSESDLLANVPGTFDVITCNPPYLTTDQMRQIGGLSHRGNNKGETGVTPSESPSTVIPPDSDLHPPASPQSVPANEPAIALDGGVDGLRIVHKLAVHALAHLRSNGYIVIEVADFQAQSVSDMLEHNGYTSIFVVRDLGGNRRVVGGQAWSK